MKKFVILGIIIGFLNVQSFAMESKTIYQAQEQQFINKTAKQYHLNRTDIADLVYEARLLPSVIWYMNRPYEAKPWYVYKKHFLKPSRVQQGPLYWQHHAKDLAAAEKKYGVPASIIVSIVGIESFYGKRQGSYSVLDALTTLAFAYPRRAKFFQNELAQYLLLSRELHFNPRDIHGSYAGAIGMPQFMPSSYRKYAVGTKDLIHDNIDVINSVANYLQQYGWQRGGLIAVPATVTGDKYKKVLTNALEPEFTVAEMRKYGVTPKQKLPANTKVGLIRLQTETGYEFWLGLNNFYVITEYNHSTRYAMAVYQLAATIVNYSF